MSSAESFSIAVDEQRRVSALLLRPAQPRAVVVLAHGAGAGMTHPFLANVADGFAARDIATLRYQFPYMERGSRRPDTAAVAEATVRAAVLETGRRCPGLPVFAAGKSFGGRMSSQAQADAPLPGVRGLVFFGFPLHAPGKPADTRGEHLFAVQVPMLFLQGTRDDFAQLQWLQPLVERLGARAQLHLVADADHSFHVPAKSGRRDGEVLTELLDTATAWINKVL